MPAAEDYIPSEADVTFTRQGWIEANSYPDGKIQCFCQRCSVEIQEGELCSVCAHFLGLPGFANDQNSFPDETEEAIYFETSCEEEYGTQQRKETLKSRDEYS